MPATREGGIKAAQTNKNRYGTDFYKKIGAMGGAKSRGGGFAKATPEQLREWGKKGGTKSRKRGANEIEQENGMQSVSSTRADMV